MDRFYSLSHSSIEFHFRQSPRDFVVEEVPLYQFCGEGEHLVLFVRKKDLSTPELISAVANYLGIKNKEIGYAGLKDKHAMTKQYISLHKKYEAQMDAFEHENIKILSKTYHNNKIRVGHLSGNKFYINLKKVNPTAATKIDEVLKNITNFGMPNYFGYQRFGNDGDNHIEGEKIVKGLKKERNHKVREFLISAYQSHLFNLWLSRRLEISKLVEKFEIRELEPLLNISKEELLKMKAQRHPLKLLSGDLMEHYPHGRLFEFAWEESDLDRYDKRDISVTGLLCGKRVKRANLAARDLEKDFDTEIDEDGARRYAWVYPLNIEGRYKSEDAHYELNFYLPKGSYATVLIEEIAKREIRTQE
ncbi:MAG: tRNA pseudouridine13 synthase [Campylobacterota bacterium]|nr:tRNA pseudouridine13 synthase [Campylobacterota bacterium]